MRTLLPALLLVLATQAAAQAPVDRELEKLKADLATAHFKVGEHLAKKGRRAEAMPQLQKALELRRATLGEQHPHTMECYAALGRCYQAGNEHKKALPLLKKALAISRR